MNWSQVELAKGTSKEELLNNPYYNAEAIHFIENVCEFLTLDAAHRQVVRPPVCSPKSIKLSIGLAKQITML